MVILYGNLITNVVATLSGVTGLVDSEDPSFWKCNSTSTDSNGSCDSGRSVILLVELQRSSLLKCNFILTISGLKVADKVGDGLSRRIRNWMHMRGLRLRRLPWVGLVGMLCGLLRIGIP